MVKKVLPIRLNSEFQVLWLGRALYLLGSS